MSTQRSTAFGRLAVVTAVLTLALVALGGAVRATDSGLACPDWPRCFGRWIPPAELPMWLEHSHRLLAGVVGIAIAVLTVWAIARFRQHPAILWASVTALVLVVAQAGLGALVVLRLLNANLVTAHLGMAMVVVACLIYLAVSASPGSGVAGGGSGAAGGGRLAWTSTAIAVLCFVQILVGGHVTGIGAGLVYTDFPLMGGAVIPSMGTAREAFHVAHRLLAYLLAGGVVYLAVMAVRHRRAVTSTGAWSRAQNWLVTLPLLTCALVLVQIVLGVANLYNRTSFVTVIPHLAVASWIWSTLILHALLAHRHASTAGATATAPSLLPESQGAPA